MNWQALAAGALIGAGLSVFLGQSSGYGLLLAGVSLMIHTVIQQARK